MIATLCARRPGAIAIGLGIVAVLAAAIYFRAREAAIADLGRPLRCLIAARDLPAQTQLAPSMLAWAEIPRQFASPGAMTAAVEAIGQVTQAPLLAGEPLSRARLQPPGDGTGFAATIPEGMRAVSLPVDAVSGVAGLIEPGNFVDLIVTFDFGEATNAQSFTMTVLERVPVLAADQRVALVDLGPAPPGGDKAAPRPARAQEQTVTLALTPDQVQRVLFAQESGRLRLALRPQAERPEAGTSAPHEPTTAASVTGMNSLVKRKEYRGR